jgi:GNAT superfamily N-acetyltransferase
MSSTASSIHIRPATKADVPTILGFIGELAEYEKLPHEMVATEASLHRHLFGPRPMAEVLISELEAREVGFALFFHNFSTFLGKPGIYLEDIYVQPQARGKGVGSALLKEIARLAVARDCGRLEWSVLDWNEPSIGFYLSLGAVAMSDWTMYRVTGDALKKLGRQ